MTTSVVEVVYGVVATGVDAGGMPVVLWVSVHGQLVIVRVVACIFILDCFLDASCFHLQKAYRCRGVCDIALDDGSRVWAVGGVRCHDLSGLVGGRGRNS